MSKILYILAIVMFIVACMTKDNSAFLYVLISIVLFLLGSIIEGNKARKKDYIE